MGGRSAWGGLFDNGTVIAEEGEEIEAALGSIRQETASHVTSEMAAKLTPDCMFSAKNIGKAIRSLRGGTAPGEDGLTIEFYRRHVNAMVPHLKALFEEVCGRRRMTAAMREARVSLLYKGKGRPREDWASYRPIAVTAMEYRILGKCVQQAMSPMLQHLVGESQPGFVAGRRIDESVLTVTELAHFCEQEGRGGLFVMLDNAAAYDRTQWGMLQKVLEAYCTETGRGTTTRRAKREQGGQ